VTSVCHRCGTEVQRERVGVREVCGGCGGYLHSCLTCELYAPGAHNDCREPLSEIVADKEAGNFCEYFGPSPAPPHRAERSSDARARLESLFRKR
jgi:hypothetical protein